MPFRDAALRVVQTIIGLMESKNKIMDVSNKKRFKEEYGEEAHTKPPKVQKPEDYRATFSGNVDDHFRIGAAPTVFQCFVFQCIHHFAFIHRLNLCNFTQGC